MSERFSARQTGVVTVSCTNPDRDDSIRIIHAALDAEINVIEHWRTCS